jgi:hypothetical protein
MLQKRFLILFLAFSLQACSTGPKVENCVSSPQEQLFHCFDARKNKPKTRKPSELENWVCLSPFDANAFFTACADHVKPPQVNACVVGSATDEFIFFCAKGDTPFLRTEGYVCMSRIDTEAVVNYCAKLKGK